MSKAAKQADTKPDAPLVSLNMRIDEGLRHRFKVWCVNQRIDMSEFVIAKIREAIGELPAPEPKRRRR